jgi:metal iron transporter
MNCPSRNDDTDKHPHWNQTPPSLIGDLTTRADLNGISNLRERESGPDKRQSDDCVVRSTGDANVPGGDKSEHMAQKLEPEKYASTTSKEPPGRCGSNKSDPFVVIISHRAKRLQEILVKYVQFIGPGFLIAVAYIDPGNYATDVNGKQD